MVFVVIDENVVLDIHLVGLHRANADLGCHAKFSGAPRDALVITWSPCVSNRQYTVLWTSDLTKGFMPLVSGIEFPQNSITNTLQNEASMGFYRIKVN